PLWQPTPIEGQAVAALDAPDRPPVKAVQLGRGDAQKAQAAADLLTDDEPKVHLLVRLAQAHAKAGDADLAKKALREAAALAARVDADVPFPSLAVNVVIAQAEAGFAVDAVKAAAELPNVYSRPGTLADIAMHQGRRGDIIGAQQTIDAI